MTSVASAFSAIADRFTRAEQVAKLNEFLTNQQMFDPIIIQTIRNAVTEAEWQIDWAVRNSPKVIDFLVDLRNADAEPDPDPDADTDPDAASITAAGSLMASVMLAIVMFVS
jgi:hypothetical protein